MSGPILRKQKLELFSLSLGFYLVDGRLNLLRCHARQSARLAEALSALRGRPMPGLDEVGEATWSVLCEGSAARAELVTRDVVVGQALGAVPDGAPMVPLDADMRATARRLRLAFSASARSLVLDLRKPTDLARSHLLRRLAIVGVDWGSPRQVSGTGTTVSGYV